MGSSNQPAYVAPPTPDPAAVAAEQRAANIDLNQTQTDLSTQTAALQRLFGGAGGMLKPAGAVAAGTQNGAASPGLALPPLFAAALGAGR